MQWGPFVLSIAIVFFAFQSVKILIRDGLLPRVREWQAQRRRDRLDQFEADDLDVAQGLSEELQRKIMLAIVHEVSSALRARVDRRLVSMAVYHSLSGLSTEVSRETIEAMVSDAHTQIENTYRRGMHR